MQASLDWGHVREIWKRSWTPHCPQDLVWHVILGPKRFHLQKQHRCQELAAKAKQSESAVRTQAKTRRCDRALVTWGIQPHHESKHFFDMQQPMQPYEKESREKDIQAWQHASMAAAGHDRKQVCNRPDLGMHIACHTWLVCLFVCLFVGWLVCFFVCLSVCLSVCLFVCLSVCLIVCLFVCLFV